MSTLSIVLHVVGAGIIFGAGYWTHYKIGARVASDAAQIRTDVKKL